MITLYVAVPCYNEEEVLPETVKRLTAKLTSLEEGGKVSKDSRILFVDDGSKDKTWELISQFHETFEMVCGLKLSRNQGHQNALIAGLDAARPHCDAAISLDCDLQDDVDAIDRFVDAYLDGCDVVYGVRSSRQTDTAFKRTTAQGFYKIMKLLGVDIVYNHADYRLMSRRALEALGDFSEVNLFLRGMVPLVGFKSTTVEYERAERFAGESKYPLKKMLAFAFDGITSFSVKPIRMILSMGILIVVLAVALLIYALVAKIMDSTNAGWASLFGSIWFLGGLQLFAIGLVGEYIGKIYKETKRRPRYFVDQLLVHEKNQNE